jgi:hypothetical protein
MEIQFEEFDEYLQRAEIPFVMRGVTLCPLAEMKDSLARSNNTQLGFQESLKVDQSEMCMRLRNRMSSLGCIFTSNRYWEHDAGHVTRWHFDGNGVQVLNICMSGSKRFDFAPPGSTLVLPFSNIAAFDPPVKYTITIHQGDVLFFPSFWFHRVTCLDNGTVTYNICTTRVIEPCPRDAANITYHRMLGTKMGSHPHFADVDCDHPLSLFPDVAIMIGLGVMLGTVTSRVPRTRVLTALLVLNAAAFFIERKSQDTQGIILACLLPFTFGAVLTLTKS